MRTKSQTLLLLLLPLLCATGLAAPQGEPPKPGKASKAGSASKAGDLNSLLGGGPRKEGVDGELQDLKREYMRTLMQYHRDRLAKMRAQGQQPQTFSFGPAPAVTEKMAPRFMAAAEKYKGKDDAMPFLEWCLLTDPRPGNATTTAALKIFLAEPLVGSKCAAAVSKFARLQRILGDAFAPTLERILEKAKTDEVKAAALFARAETRQKSNKDKAIDDYKRALELAPKAAFAGAARGALRGLTVLAVGRPAPEIEGEDLDGVQFKLSDYRGKAVMLSFWGDW